MSENTLFNYNTLPAGIPLSQFTSAISRVVNASSELNGTWVIAELSDVRISGGHCYMELIEKNDAGQTIAKLRATIWQFTFNNLRRKFFNATQKDIITGLKVLVKGNATHHSLYGLSFNITDIDPSYTLGDLERLRLEILQKLAKEGVLNNNKQLSFPIAPQRIAVISAEGAAGYGDFINHLTGNAEGFVFYPVLFPAMMQGDRVSASIRDSLKTIISNSQFFDCIAIVRGGGATTDMNGFDDYDLAKAVATSPLPVVVGIGHERDRNVLDEIACISVKTPTAVAGFFIDKLRNVYEGMIYLADKIRETAVEKLRGEERRLATIQSVVPQLALRRLSDNKARLHNLSGKLPLLVAGRIERENINLSNKVNLLSSFSKIAVSKGKQLLDSIEQLLKALDPSNTLQRGYSITRVNGKAITNADDISTDDILTIQLYKGTLSSKIIK